MHRFGFIDRRITATFRRRRHRAVRQATRPRRVHADQGASCHKTGTFLQEALRFLTHTFLDCQRAMEPALGQLPYGLTAPGALFCPNRGKPEMQERREEMYLRTRPACACVQLVVPPTPCVQEALPPPYEWRGSPRHFLYEFYSQTVRQ